MKGYSSLLNHVGAQRYVRSDTFEAGGFDWAVRYYPFGDTSARPGYVSAYLEFLTRGRAEARASCSLTVVPWSGSAQAQRPTMSWQTGTLPFRDSDNGYACGWSSLVKRKVVESPAYLRDDAVTVECTVTVFQQPWNSGTRRLTSPAPVETHVVEDQRRQDEPGMSEYLGMLLDAKTGDPLVDVTFLVGPEAFSAHRFVLWVRCRRLFDRTRSSPLVTIPEYEVQPAVFRILLHYIYRESLPAVDDLDGGEKAEMLRHLLTAAKRYGVEKLKRVCERTLAG